MKKFCVIIVIILFIGASIFVYRYLVRKGVEKIED